MLKKHCSRAKWEHLFFFIALRLVYRNPLPIPLVQPRVQLYPWCSFELDFTCKQMEWGKMTMGVEESDSNCIIATHSLEMLLKIIFNIFMWEIYFQNVMFPAFEVHHICVCFMTYFGLIICFLCMMILFNLFSDLRYIFSLLGSG